MQYKLLPLFDAMLYSADFPEGFRTAVGLRGFRVGHGRQPMTDAQHEQIEALSRVLQCILAEEGYADQPVSGCPPKRPSAAEMVEIDRIVQGVLSELKRRGVE